MSSDRDATAPPRARVFLVHPLSEYMPRFCGEQRNVVGAIVSTCECSTGGVDGAQKGIVRLGVQVDLIRRAEELIRM